MNVDIRQTDAVDVVADCGTLDQWEDGSVDLIYACHLLDQFSRHQYMDVLRTWYRKLKVGGILRLSCVDFEQVALRYHEKRNLRELIGLLHARQDYPTNVRKVSWDWKTITEDLKSVGFTTIRPWNWRYTEHTDVDDCSKAYLPHMDFANGNLMSLNCEGVK